MVGSGFTVLMAPQIFRFDLRQVLQHLELLKTWPVQPAAVVRGEILWPAVLTTAILYLRSDGDGEAPAVGVAPTAGGAVLGVSGHW